MRTIWPVGTAMSARSSEKIFVLPGLFGGPLETRTPDSLIKSSPKLTNQAKPNQKFPKFSGHFSLSLWVDLVPSAASSRTIRGQILDCKPTFGLRVAGERLYGRKSLCRSASRMG